MMTQSQPDKPSVWENSVPILLSAACVGLAGLFVQTAKLDASMSVVVSDIQELMLDSKDRLNLLEARVRALELRIK